MNLIKKTVVYESCMEVNMSDISTLLQEARPLYFARKKRNNRIKAVVCMLVLAVGLNFAIPQKKIVYSEYGTEPWLSLPESQISSLEQDSVIKDMGLPVDDFGLLMVS